MTSVRVLESATYRLDEIYYYTKERWGAAQLSTISLGFLALLTGLHPTKFYLDLFLRNLALMGIFAVTSIILSIGESSKVARLGL